MQRIHISKAPVTDLFNSDRCNINNGSVIIELRNCNVIINPSLTLNNAAKLAAKKIYEVMQHDEPLSQEPEWLNSVTFSSEEFIDTPAVKIIDNKLYFNSPPFLKTKRNINFWKHFTDYWYIMVVRAMEGALVARKDKTFFEEQIIEKYADMDI